LYRTATQNGSYDEMKNLADCIIDDKPALAQEAADILDFLLSKGYYTSSVLLKLSKLYRNPKYKMLDIQKSIEKLEIAIKLGNYVAKSNLAFYYYKGIGVKQDIKIAYKLLKEANDADIQKWGGKGSWSEELKKLEEETKKR
jgi:TPR repeat protein